VIAVAGATVHTELSLLLTTPIRALSPPHPDRRHPDLAFRG
jgi:hypothetical protein